MEPTFDIQNPSQKQSVSHARRAIVIASIVIIVLAAILIILQIKQKRAYEAYLRTPEGQLQALEATSDPVTTPDQERYRVLTELQATSGPSSTMSQEDRIKVLESLE